MPASTITGSTLTIGTTNFTQTYEVGPHTKYVDKSVETTSPLRLEIQHSQSTKKNSARNSTIILRNVVPFTTATGGVVQENLQVQVTLRHIPDYLYADKSSKINALFSLLVTMLGDSNILAALQAGVADLSGSTASA